MHRIVKRIVDDSPHGRHFASDRGAVSVSTANLKSGKGAEHDRCMFKLLARKRRPIAVLVALAAAASWAWPGGRGSLAASAGSAAANDQDPGEGHGLGQPQRPGLPRTHLTEESAIKVNLSKETVRLPLYPGTAYAGTPQPRRCGTCCWTPPTRGWRTTWASTTRRSSPTSRSATRPRCRP